MSTVWLFRHGQAGTRNRYDTLSPLGREQARRLGEMLAAQGIRFSAALSGRLERQQETAAEVAAAYCRAGLPFPGIEFEPGWNEFDLDAVYGEIAPALAAADPRFRSEYAEMRAQMADEDHDIHRRWSRCDMLVLRAWIAGSVPVRCETWCAFQERIAGALVGLTRFGPEEQVAVFTSATPMGLACGAALGAGEKTSIRLAGALLNSAYATLQRREGEWWLFSFNNAPHLGDESLRSSR